jgi:TRAP-type mannitol/chloroaromatic compound transport system permease small subunit
MGTSQQNGQGEGAVMSAPTKFTIFLRSMAWVLVIAVMVFLFNDYLNFWRGWPGFVGLLSKFGLWASDERMIAAVDKNTGLAWIQAASYVGGICLGVWYVLSTRTKSLRADAESLYAISAYIARAAYWSVLLIGLVDSVISFLRVEDLLSVVVGEQLTSDLGRSQFRGPYVHLPLVLLSLVIAWFTRTLGFIWLTLLVVVAELQIVIARFVFSYEQAFMGDLVRFWYGALFLFASAYTLIEEGHVRVDVLYAGFKRKTRAKVNAWGSVILGMTLCIVILTVGLWGKSNIINGPLLTLEISQSGFGLYVKYIMGGFLVVYAVTMLIQFSGYMLSAVADYRDEPALEEKPLTMGGSGEAQAVEHRTSH